MATLRELITKLSFTANLDPLVKVSKAVDGIKSRLNLLVGVEAVRGLINLSDKFGTFAIDIRNSAEAAGITADEFQRLAYAAAQSGVSQESLGKTLSTLNKRLQEARLGSEEANLAFARAGITPEQLGSFRNAEDALFAVGKSLKSIPDPVLRASAAWNTLGEGNIRLVASLNDGDKGLRALSKSANAAKSSLSPGMLDQLIASEQAMIAMRAAVASLTAKLLSAFAPMITKVVKGLSTFIDSIYELTSTSWTKFTYNVGYAMGYTQGVVEDVYRITSAMVRLFVKFGQDTKIFAGITVAVKALWSVISFNLGLAIDAFVGFGVALGYIASEVVNAFDKLDHIADHVRETWTSLINYFEGSALQAFARLIKAVGEVTYALVTMNPQGVADGFKSIGDQSQRLWDMWTKWDFSKTGLGQAIAAISDLRANFGSFGDGPRAENYAEKLDREAAMSSIQKIMAPMPSFAGSTQGLSPDLAGKTQIINNSPVTINVAGTADPAKLYDSVRDGIADHHDKILRQAQAAGAVAVVY